MSMRWGIKVDARGSRLEAGGPLIALLQLCDSLFPIGSFAHSDGLEAATANGEVASAEDLSHWMEAGLDQSFGCCDGPALLLAWTSFRQGDWARIREVDDEVHALRPSSSVRAAGRNMGARLLKTWTHIRPGGRISEFEATNSGAFTLPVAFGIVCAAEDIDAAAALNAYAYTRLAAACSAAMRLMPIGQHEAHRLLAVTLQRVPALVDAIIARGGGPSVFAPALDIAAMAHQYVPSRLFRS